MADKEAYPWKNPKPTLRDRKALKLMFGSRRYKRHSSRKPYHVRLRPLTARQKGFVRLWARYGSRRQWMEPY